MGEFSANFMDEVSCASSNLKKYMYVINVCLCSLYWHKIEGCPLHSNWLESFMYRPTRSYIKVNMATRWTIRQALMLLWFKDLMNVTKEAIIHRPNISTLTCLVPSSEVIQMLQQEVLLYHHYLAAFFSDEV